MAISIDLSSTSESIYQNTQNNPPIKLTLCERVSQLFSRLYEKISNLFSRKPSQIKKLERIESIYDVPKNNRLVQKPTLCERISNLFSKGPSRIELEERVDRVDVRSQKDYQELHHLICVNVRKIEHLDNCVYILKDMVDAKEVQINSLEKFILSLEDELYSNRTQVSRSDSGFSEPLNTGKKQNFFSEAGQRLKTKIGLGNH